MNVAEIISQQIYFENTRQGVDKTWWQQNSDLQHTIRRTQEEFVELQEAQNPRDQLEEAVDVMIMMGSYIAHICVANGISVSEADKLLEDKLMNNEKKYKSEHFAGKTLTEGIVYSRQAWQKR